MVEEGIVKGVKGGNILINITRRPACSLCRLCSKGEERLMQIEVENSVKAQPGDQVLLELDDSTVLKGAAIAYMLPLAFLLTGLFGGNWLAGFMGLAEFREITSVVCGFGLLALAFFAIKRFELIKKGRFRPKVRIKD